MLPLTSTTKQNDLNVTIPHTCQYGRGSTKVQIQAEVCSDAADRWAVGQ